MTSKLAISPDQHEDISPDQRVDMVESVKMDDLTCDDNAVGYETHDNLGSVAEIECECEDLKRKTKKLQCSLAESRREIQRSLFRLENIKDDDEMVKFHTGIPDQVTLMAFYEEILEDDAKSMRLWTGKNSKNFYTDSKTDRHSKLPLTEQFFMTLVRLCLGLLEQDLVKRFGMSVSSVSRTTATWINLMFHSFKVIERFPPWHIVEKHMPEAFRKEYPNTRLTIDTTELQVERPSSLLT